MSDCLDRRIVIDLVADLVGTRHTVQLEGPAWTIMIQTFKVPWPPYISIPHSSSSPIR